MGTHLHQALRTLCFSTDWKYAVFWKLKELRLTWADTYFDSHEQHDPSENKQFSEKSGNFHDVHYSHDPLGLAVTKMSHHVYSLGEGIVGQVAAVAGTHLWIFADEHITDFISSFEFCDGWKTQFLAGIKTVVLVSVVPHGVVQLGSLNKITEDLKLVNHIRAIFFAFQDSSVVQYNMETCQCLSDMSTRSSGSGIFNYCTCNKDENGKQDKTNMGSPMIPYPRESGDCSYIVPPVGYLEETIETISKHRRLESSTPGVCGSATSPYKQALSKLFIDSEDKRNISGSKDLCVVSEDNDTLSSHKYFINKTDLCNFSSSFDNSRRNILYFPTDCHGSGGQDYQNGVLRKPEHFDMQMKKDLEEKNLKIQTKSNCMDTVNVSSEFSAGCELYEALGPAFWKQKAYTGWEEVKSEVEMDMEMPEGMSCCSLLTTDSVAEHLLEAVVANVCCSSTNVKSDKSSCKSEKSLLTAEKMLEPTFDKHTIGSADYSFDQSLLEDKFLSLNSTHVIGNRSSGGFSSLSSTCSEQLKKTQEPTKINRKRARSGENCRPRPRDRQLIQDRIKELRELVPNGSKCSIDSLLERTVKHMLFLQSITRHADNLNKFGESKLHDKEKDICGLSKNEQGSSWVVEVGSHLKVCSIMVETINTNGQMLIEMLCEECSHFLEIAEAIRSLGLTILKGAAEAHGERTWIIFVVEGQNNRSMHRVDILWSLVQVLQPTTVI